MGLDGRVCLVGMRKSIYLPRGYDKPKVAHDFPSHAVHALPWMAPEILQQVQISLLAVHACALEYFCSI